MPVRLTAAVWITLVTGIAFGFAASAMFYTWASAPELWDGQQWVRAVLAVCFSAVSVANIIGGLVMQAHK